LYGADGFAVHLVDADRCALRLFEWARKPGRNASHFTGTGGAAADSNTNTNTNTNSNSNSNTDANPNPTPDSDAHSDPDPNSDAARCSGRWLLAGHR
jgi:hypothetical protein